MTAKKCDLSHKRSLCEVPGLRADTASVACGTREERPATPVFSSLYCQFVLFERPPIRYSAVRGDQNIIFNASWIIRESAEVPAVLRIPPKAALLNVTFGSLSCG